MIDLYKLHWSHYVEKVRWALDFKGLAWRGIDIVAFTMREHLRDETFLYEDLVLAQRKRSGTMRGAVRWMQPPYRESVAVGDVIAPLQAAINDQRPVSRWTLIFGLPGYLKLRWFSGVRRLPFAASPRSSA